MQTSTFDHTFLPSPSSPDLANTSQRWFILHLLAPAGQAHLADAWSGGQTTQLDHDEHESARKYYYSSREDVIKVGGQVGIPLHVDADDELVKLPPCTRRDNDLQLHITKCNIGPAVGFVEPFDAARSYINFDKDIKNPGGLDVDGFFAATDLAPSLRLRISLRSGHEFIAQGSVDLPFTGDRAMEQVQMSHHKGSECWEIDIKLVQGRFQG
jgi:hypothetical protein